MNEQDRHELFSELITRHQNQLYAYVFAVVRKREDADDLFQSVCLILWRKFGTFRPGSSFFSWARQTAKFVVCSFLRHRKNLPTCASEELLDALSETVSQGQDDGADSYLAALQHCKGKLSATDGELLELRYAENLGSGGIADRLQRPQQSVCQSLKRVRRWMLECIRLELARQERSGENLP
jgi:RNA polymerase sigma-70 factor (ECF subfamily)